MSVLETIVYHSSDVCQIIMGYLDLDDLILGGVNSQPTSVL